jgi:glycosyltransferase involved in cell wall biosynthesis
MNVDVSVIIPTYNRAHIFPKAVNSALAQTLENIEIIVVDDASTDNTDEVFQELFGGCSNVRLVAHEQNSGVSAARNTGLRAANGEFVAFLDSDDLWEKQKLERQLHHVRAAKHPEMAMCICQTRVVSTNGDVRIRPSDNTKVGEDPGEYLYVFDGFAQVSSFFLTRELALKTGFHEDLKQYEDHLFFIQAVNGSSEFVFINEALSTWMNDDRADRLSTEDDYNRGHLFLKAVGDDISARAKQAFDIKYLIDYYRSRSLLTALGKIVKGYQVQALTMRQALRLLIRILAGREKYEAIKGALLRRHST